jgi:signal transduction histidine kinase
MPPPVDVAPLEHRALASAPNIDHAPARPPRGIGFYLIALILIAAVPLLVSAALLVVRQGALQREAFEDSLQQTSRALSLAVDRQLVTYRVMLESLGEADALRNGDIEAFHEFATRVADRHGAVFISMFDANGRQLFNTLRPAGQALPTPFDHGVGSAAGRPPVGDSDSIRRVLDTGKAYYSDLFVGLVAGRLIFTVNVPVMRDGRVAYVLNAAFPPRVMTALLNRNEQFRNVPAVIFDRRGFIAGRWQRDDVYVGTNVEPGRFVHVGEADTGVNSGTTKEGIPVVYSFTRSPVTGWTATVGIERERLESDLRDTWLAGALLAAGGLGLGLVLALLVASRLRASIGALSSAAVRNEPPKVEGLRTREIADLERALVDAAAARQQQAHEREERLVAEARKADAEEANRSKDHFLAVLSHELRNPLAPIRNAVTLMRAAVGRGEHPPSAVVDVLDRQSEQLTRLVNDLLDRARITSGRIALQRERVDLRAVARHAIETVMPGVEARRQTLQVEMPETTVVVDGDFARLSQVVTNLLDNAVKFTAHGGRIELSLSSDASHATLTIADNGRGIDPGVLESIFTPFRQAAPGPHALSGSLGLGLSLARALVDLHGGSLRAQSDGPGRGSTFTVRLPRVESVQHTDASGRARTGSGGRGARILVVDDNADAALTTQALLTLLGHEAHIASDGSEALDRFAGLDPDVVLLDIGLPGLDGYEVARLMRERATRPNMLVALTGWGKESDRRRAREAGFDAHLVKPVDPETLQRTIGNAGSGNT